MGRIDGEKGNWMRGRSGTFSCEVEKCINIIIIGHFGQLQEQF